jgi:hypothetical protein
MSGASLGLEFDRASSSFCLEFSCDKNYVNDEVNLSHKMHEMGQ